MFDDFPFFRRKIQRLPASVVRLSRQMHVQRDQIVVGHAFEIRLSASGASFASANELNKASGRLALPDLLP